jgi:hypothetical protein
MKAHQSTIILGATATGKTTFSYTSFVMLGGLLGLRPRWGPREEEIRYGVRLHDKRIEDRALHCYQAMQARPEGGDGWPGPTEGLEPFKLSFTHDQKDVFPFDVTDIAGRLVKENPQKDEEAKQLVEALRQEPGCVMVMVPTNLFSDNPDADQLELLGDVRGELCWINRLIAQVRQEKKLRQTCFVVLVTKADLATESQEVYRQKLVSLLPDLFKDDALTLMCPFTLFGGQQQEGGRRLRPRNFDLPFVFAALHHLLAIGDNVLAGLPQFLAELQNLARSSEAKVRAEALPIDQATLTRGREKIYGDRRQHEFNGLKDVAQRHFDHVKGMSTAALKQLADRAQSWEACVRLTRERELIGLLRERLREVTSIYRGGEPITAHEI